MPRSPVGERKASRQLRPFIPDERSFFPPRRDGEPSDRASCRFGVWVDGVFSWVGDDRWRRTLIYEPDATVTAVRLECDNPRIAIRVTDVVDFAVNLMVRKFVVERGSGRDVRLFLHHDFHIYGHPI